MVVGTRRGQGGKPLARKWIDSHDETFLRSRSFNFAPGPNRSWKLMSSSISSSIIFIVEAESGGARSCDTGDGSSNVDVFSCKGDSGTGPSVTRPPPFSTNGRWFSSALGCASPFGCRVSRKAFSMASRRLPRSSALACSLPTHSTNALTRLFMSVTLMRFPGHLTFTPRSVLRSNDSRPLGSMPDPRTSSGCGTPVGSIASR